MKQILNILLTFLGFRVSFVHCEGLRYWKKLIINNSVKVDLSRIGSTNDGGYLVPKDHMKIKHLISLGVCDDSEFELEFANLGARVSMFDGSVEGPAAEHKNFNFYKDFVGNWSIAKHAKLSTFLSSLEGDAALSMDIEGFEYSVLNDLSYDDLRKLKWMTIEFHFLDDLLSRKSSVAIISAFEKILNDFFVVHIHINNVTPVIGRGNDNISELLEFTFLRKDLISNPLYRKPSASYLDSPNFVHLSDTKIDELFRGSYD